MRSVDNIIQETIDEYLSRNMVNVRNNIKQAKDDWGDSWASEPYGEDDRELIHNEWMIHFSNYQNVGSIGKHGFTMGNDVNGKLEQVTYQRAKKGKGFNYAYLASDVLESFNATTDVELNDLRSSFMYYLSQERQDSFVMFKGNGFRFFHIGDAENQVVFDSIQEDTKVVIYYLNNKYYCVMSATSPKMHNKQSCKKSAGGFGKENPKNQFSDILYFSRDIEKVIKWVMTNYEQYKRKFNYNG